MMSNSCTSIKKDLCHFMGSECDKVELITKGLTCKIKGVFTGALNLENDLNENL